MIGAGAATAAAAGAKAAAAAIGADGAVCAGASAARKTIPLSSIVASTRRSISRSAIRVSISASGVGGSAPKYRSRSARSRKYSAIAFIVAKESSNPSSVHEKVPYETVRILLDSTMFSLAFFRTQWHLFTMNWFLNGNRMLFYAVLFRVQIVARL